MKTAGIIIGLFFILGIVIAIGGLVFSSSFISRAPDVKGPGGAGGVLISEDGATFASVESLGGLESHTIIFSDQNPDVVYLGAKNYGLWVSQNGGKKFSVAKDALLKTAIDIYDIKESGNDLYMAAYRDSRGSIIHATSGKAPTEVYFSSIARFGVFEIATESLRVLSFVSSDGGYYRSINAGKSWEVRSRQKEGLLKLKRASNGTVWAVTSENKILRSVDAGKTWIDVSVEKGGFSRSPINNFFLDSRTNTLLVASNKLHRSTNGGTTWEVLNLIIPTADAVISAAALHLTNANIIYAASKNILYKSIDGGASWSINTLPTTRTVSTIAINPRNPNSILIGTIK